MNNLIGILLCLSIIATVVCVIFYKAPENMNDMLIQEQEDDSDKTKKKGK